MNLIDAIKSGKRFKLGERTCDWKESGLRLIINLSQDMILSDHWIIEEEKVTITKSQLEQSIQKYGSSYYLNFDNIAKELGFK